MRFNLLVSGLPSVRKGLALPAPEPTHAIGPVCDTRAFCCRNVAGQPEAAPGTAVTCRTCRVVRRLVYPYHWLRGWRLP